MLATLKTAIIVASTDVEAQCEIIDCGDASSHTVAKSMIR
jgi:hypothetical protein